MGSLSKTDTKACRCPFGPQTVLQLPPEAPGSNMDHRQGAGERSVLPVLEEDPRGGIQVRSPASKRHFSQVAFFFKPRRC